MEQVASKLAEHGVLGVLLIAAGYVIFKLYQALEESRKGRTAEVEAVQNARIDDGKAVLAAQAAMQAAIQTQLVELIKTCTAAIVGSGAAQNATRESIGELRETLDKLLEKVDRIGK